MDHGQLTMIADKFQWVFSESFASQSVETSADVHCAFNAFWGTTMTSKALYTQLAAPLCRCCSHHGSTAQQ